MRLLGAIARKSGRNGSPLEMLIGMTRSASPASSRNIVISWPFGVVQS